MIFNCDRTSGIILCNLLVLFQRENKGIDLVLVPFVAVDYDFVVVVDPKNLPLKSKSLVKIVSVIDETLLLLLLMFLLLF